MSDLTIEVKNDAMLGRTTEKALHIELIKKDQEIERLNNIINEIENKMLSIIYKNIPVIYKEYDLLNQEVKEYFKELKGEDKE